MTIDTEKVILTQLQYNEDFTRKVIPYLKPEYFLDSVEKNYFVCIAQFFEKYNALPTREALHIVFSGLKVKQEEYEKLKKYADEAYNMSNVPQDDKWLLETTEKFCKDQSLYLALQKALEISDGSDKNLSTTAIPEIFQKALSVSFDINIGHDYVKDANERFDYYHEKTERIPFRLSSFNNITKNGIKKKTVQCIAAGTGVGKSMLMCQLAADYMLDGKNVLYITMEMSEKDLAQRIDANIMDMTLDDFAVMDPKKLQSKFATLNAKLRGAIKFKEYPNGTAHTGHFKFLLRELKTKQNFVPDVIFIDYMNICASSRVASRSDMYSYIKSIAEELRAMAQECDVPIWTATQTNRSGQTTTDIDITNISESMGGPATFDLLFAVVSNEDLASMDQVMVIQLKNRYSDVFKNRKFNLGVDRSKMRFYDLTQNTQVTTIMAKQPPMTNKPSISSTSTKKGNTVGIKV